MDKTNSIIALSIASREPILLGKEIHWFVIKLKTILIASTSRHIRK
jgi:hypothetical protein